MCLSQHELHSNNDISVVGISGVMSVAVMIHLCGAAGPQSGAMHVKCELVYKVWVGCEPPQAEAGCQKLGKAIKAHHAAICV